MGADDFKGLDLDGKIAVLFGGAPARFDNDRRAFHSSYREKLREVDERGANGAVFVNTAQDEAGDPWAELTATRNKPARRRRDDAGHGSDSLPQLREGAAVREDAEGESGGE